MVLLWSPPRSEELHVDLVVAQPSSMRWHGEEDKAKVGTAVGVLLRGGTDELIEGASPR